MTATTAVSTVAVLLALLLISALWTRRRPTWQIVFGPPRDPPNRIPLTEFYVEARNRGWDFGSDRQLFLDLAIGLREAALAGSIEMWGRKCRAMAVLAAPQDALLRIPAEFWKHHVIDGLRMAIARPGNDGAATTEGMETNNFLIQTRALPTSDADFDDASYRDIHLNYIQAMDWLQTDADACKGTSRRGLPDDGSGG